MSIVIRKYEQKDIEQMNCIWNEVVDDGIAFPQLEILDEKMQRVRDEIENTD